MSTIEERAVTERLTRVETKLDMVLMQIGPQQVDHETRIRRLERTVWLASGAALAGGGALGTIASLLLGGGG